MGFLATKANNVKIIRKKRTTYQHNIHRNSHLSAKDHLEIFRY